MRTSHRRLLWAFVLLVVAFGSWWLLRSEQSDATLGTADGRPSVEERDPAPVTLTGRPEGPAPPTPTPASTSPVPDPTPAPANGYVIEGTVRDSATGAPVVGAEVVGFWETMVQAPGTRSFKLERHEIKGDVLDAGRFRIEVVGSPLPQVQTLELADASLQVIRLERENLGDPPLPTAPDVDVAVTLRPGALIDVRPGGVSSIVLWVRKVFRVRGVVQDPQGRPLDNVHFSHVVPQVGYNGMLVLGNTIGSTRADGQFDIGPFAHDPLAGIPENLAPQVRNAVAIVFKHGSYATLRLDPSDIPEEQRNWFVVVMTEGATLAGTLVGPRGQPIADAAVVVEYGDAWDLRRGVRTDAEGGWRIQKLSPGKATLSARAFREDLKAKRDIVVAGDDLDVRLVAEQIRWEKPHPTTTVLGLGIAEVDEELRQAFEIPEYVKLVILDPGPDVKRLGIGDLERGYGIWYVGKSPVATVQEMLTCLVDSSSAKSMDDRGRIVYTFWNEEMAGTNTQHLRLDAEQIAELTALRDRLGSEGRR